MEPLTILVCILSTTVLAVYLYTKWSFTYWKRRGVYYLEPEFPYGNAKSFVKGTQFFGDNFSDIYKVFKSKGLKGGGFYMFLKPTYMPIDIELVKNILQRDFGHFVNRGRPMNKKVDPLSGHLFNMENQEWRNLRMKLTPTFTAGSEFILP